MDLEKSLHEKYINSLNLYRFIKRLAFQQAFLVANDDQKKKANEYISNCEQSKLEIWTKIILRKHNLFEFFDFNSLKELAKELGLYKYNKLDKEGLIIFIKHAFTKETVSDKSDSNRNA